MQTGVQKVMKLSKLQIIGIVCVGIFALAAVALGVICIIYDRQFEGSIIIAVTAFLLILYGIINLILQAQDKKFFTEVVGPLRCEAQGYVKINGGKSIDATLKLCDNAILFDMDGYKHTPYRYSSVEYDKLNAHKFDIKFDIVDIGSIKFITDRAYKVKLIDNILSKKLSAQAW